MTIETSPAPERIYSSPSCPRCDAQIPYDATREAFSVSWREGRRTVTVILDRLLCAVEEAFEHEQPHLKVLGPAELKRIARRRGRELEAKVMDAARRKHATRR